MARDLVLAVCKLAPGSSPKKLALYDTCSSDIHVVKDTRACAYHLPKGNSKIR